MDRVQHLPNSYEDDVMFGRKKVEAANCEKDYRDLETVELHCEDVTVTFSKEEIEDLLKGFDQ
jgi:hypothetical protein